jgi:hypothetical protein
MNGETKVQFHPSQRLITPNGAQVDIDEDMVSLVRTLWSLDLETTACCQDFGDGTAGQRDASQDCSGYGGDAFIAFYAGYSWLKMPVSDAKLLVNYLIGTEFHDKVTQRWTRGSWRMYLPMVFADDHRRIDLADDAQIHFPREQIPALTSMLENIRG